MAFLRAPGTVRFEHEQVVVILELPLYHRPHTLVSTRRCRRSTNESCSPRQRGPDLPAARKVLFRLARVLRASRSLTSRIERTRHNSR
ncbi:MAG TPA: hypothetical protein DEF51_14540 [Myxococcales bacterium]|nr:hypothetical protein [Myxococcales bacterium]